ncbi:MAG: response regulator [Terriglobia bacterium]
MTTLAGNLETILVVDDHAGVLAVVGEILQRANFQVLSATSSAAAIKLADESDLLIDLLLASLNMPLMSGPDLGEMLKKSRPKMHVLLMSGGYNQNLLVLNYGWTYIQKPFVPVRLVEMVLSVLNSPDRSQPGGREFDTRKDAKNA